MMGKAITAAIKVASTAPPLHPNCRIAIDYNLTCKKTKTRYISFRMLINRHNTNKVKSNSCMLF